MAKKSNKTTAKKNIEQNKVVAKKNNNVKKSEKENVIFNNELINLLKIVLIVCAVLIVFYLATVLIHKDNNDVIEDTTAVIQYDKILVGEILNRNENEYYVLVENEDDKYLDLYKQYLTIDNNIDYYIVDLSDIFNQQNVDDETKVEGNDVAEYKFADTTLLKIKNGNLAEVYVNREDIIGCLEDLIK